MKKIKNYIIEKLHINKDVKDPYNYHPKTKDELISDILDKIDKEGLGTEDKPLNLNDICTSEITDMSELFDATDGDLKELSDNGYFDISNWDVSNVRYTEYMFYYSNFNGDISKWDVSSVKNMSCMFYGSKFTGKNGDISKWDVCNVKGMRSMFHDSSFDTDISNWKINDKLNMKYMFYNCPLQNNPPKWYKS